MIFIGKSLDQAFNLVAFRPQDAAHGCIPEGSTRGNCTAIQSIS